MVARFVGVFLPDNPFSDLAVGGLVFSGEHLLFFPESGRSYDGRIGSSATGVSGSSEG